MHTNAAKHMVRLTIPGSDLFLQMTNEAKGIFDMDQFLMQMYKKSFWGYMPITEYKIFTLVLSSFSNT